MVIGLGFTISALVVDDPTPRIVPAQPARPQAVTLSPQPVAVRAPGFASWALLDRNTGRITGSPNQAATSDTMSMIKVWLASDFLRQQFYRNRDPGAERLDRIATMIRDSENGPAEDLYEEMGRESSIRRMVATCGLTETTPVPGRWSNTVTSARDTVRIGLCVADGRAAGPRWTTWVVDQMRNVRGTGDFGVRAALPADAATAVAIKNGWLLREEDELWHVSCLAIAPEWVLGVLARYPSKLGFAYGRDLCRSVGTQLLAR
ncbi:hypothetical protein GCM10010123_21060 [Pilimelia anulata]|uniref:Uncharacterized protein n=1 Tax=Pilimelia anulata TaxID=53371 RepID=A0A8J3F8T9_9ACTN|nr:hypothetical protein [Pilimelia anulata]GGJ90961.1 hypothetical protein GCM10010123_21060 [Pilimelia anulata]